MSHKKISIREKIKFRIRKKISGITEKPRLSIFRSNTAIYAQLIDDTKGVTLVSVASNDKELKSNKEVLTKSEKATLVGKTLATKAIHKGIATCVFDRSGYLYHGRVKALADGAREGGLKF
ncbi:MAG: 50S ribosomal protein L18 [Chitinophagaceae bacterium]